jgi:Rho GTPase-activating protein 32
MTTCPSRELSELGLNFDREEPEMRIFSESESLVSSPRVAKDSVPRRVLRARPEDISSTANSVNPSPKKQPRLNLSSPGELKTWATIINEVSNENAINEESSSCKRYKLEDQLSDIQFIDCNTPEHSVTTTLAASANTGYTIYTQIQIHDLPSIYDQQEQHKTIIDTTNTQTPLRQENERYSYPVTQYTTYGSKKEERFSYPIAISSSLKEANVENIYKTSINESSSKKTKKLDTVETQSDQNQILVKDVQRSMNLVESETNRSKLSITTPQSPIHSPGYSLLIGSTASSVSSSPVNTPIYDMEICNHYEPVNFSKSIVVMQASEDKRKAKKELSLDLSKNLNKINVTSSPSTPHLTTSDKTNETGNTSQSVTPSEIGYQNFYNRQISVTPEIDDKNELVVKPTIVHVSSSPANQIPADKTSPIKSTISITYNLKSPSSAKSDSSQQKFFNDDFQQENLEKDGLLETSFDETMVYEQVKFFKSAVDQVNDLVDERTPQIANEKKDEANAEEHYEIVFKNDEKLIISDVYMKDERVDENDKKREFDQELETQDSLEFDQNLSLYENVDVRKPVKIYENVQMPTSLNSSPVRQPRVSFGKNYAVDDLDRQIESQKSSEKSPTSLTNVRKLATKFETSPVDVQPSFDFNKSPSHRKQEVQLRKGTRNADLYTITRSLDENAFIREFGSAKKFEEFNKSVTEIADLTILSSNSSSRRKSQDYSKPKSLNQPKKLPGFNPHIPEKHENCRISVGDSDGGGHKLKLNIGDGLEYKESQRSPSVGSERLPLQTFNVRITPTTENRISLIQSNFEDKKTISDDEKSTSTTSLTSLKMLKLDRERIEKIKEERRLQLNEKYRSESFRNLNNNIKITKPKPSIDDFNDDISINSQRFKSKSRNELDSEQPYSFISAASSSTNNLTSNSRIRRISDEKNQNDLDSGCDDQVVLRKKVAEVSASDSKFESKLRQKFEKKSFEPNRERNSSGSSLHFSQSSNQ